MKKNKNKRIPVAPQAGSPKISNQNSHQPPRAFISEISTLFNTGKLDLAKQKADNAIKSWPNHPIGWKALGNIFLMQGKQEDALKHFTRCDQLAPGDAQVLNNIGSIYLEMKQLKKAEQNYRKALGINPNYAQAHNNLGITLLESGQLENAESSYRQALSFKPDFAEAHNNLGNVLKELGQPGKAEVSFRKALTHRQNFPEALCNLGNVLLEIGNPEEAITIFQKAISLKPDYPQINSCLGDAYQRLGRLTDAISCYRKGIERDPLDVKAHDGLNKATGSLVPLWHVPMMNDGMRNDAYFNALKAAISPDTHVLEIGTGSGLLAMMAAKLGAREVTTCEAVSRIADTAKNIISANNLTSTVKVIAKMSTKVQVGKDMDTKADILVSEILSSEFLGEGVLSSIEDAKRRLIKPDAQIIPARGSIQFALFSGDDIAHNIRVDKMHGFDLSRFNAIVPRKQYVNRSDLQVDLLTNDTCAFFFDFVQTDRFPSGEKKQLEVPVRKTGRCYGIIQWLRLEMDDKIIFENHPSIKNPASGWQHCMYVFPEPVDLKRGQTALVTVVHNRNTPWFFFDGIKPSS